MMGKGDFFFIYPWVLSLLLLVPILGGWFLYKQRQYWRDAFAFSQISALKHLRHQKHPVLYQRVLPVFLLLALISGIVGLAEPAWKTRVATHNSYIMLVMDISISMEATDLQPNRLEAAKSAAIDFVRSLPDGTKLGLSFFAGNNYLVSPPTEDHKLIIAYLKSLQKEDLRPGTAIGDAVLSAVDTLHTTINRLNPKETTKKDKAKQPQGSIILLTDGENNLGTSPIVGAEEAAKQKISIFAIGMGEETGAYVRGGIFTHLDEPTLQTIAQTTGGNYYRVRSLRDFKDIYNKIGQKTLSYEEKTLSLTSWLLAVSTLCVLACFVWATHFRRF